MCIYVALENVEGVGAGLYIEYIGIAMQSVQGADVCTLGSHIYIYIGNAEFLWRYVGAWKFRGFCIDFCTCAVHARVQN